MHLTLGSLEAELEAEILVQVLIEQVLLGEAEKEFNKGVVWTGC